jgi:carboxymethylenebutenolidase
MTKAVQDLMVEVARIRDAFHAAIYSGPDLDAAMTFTTPGCTLINLPSGAGASGEGLRRYLAEDVLPQLPADLTFRRISRTVDRWRVAQEDMVRFTHDRELPWLLPGVAPTGRPAEVLAVSVVTVERSRIASHRTLWDQATLLAQLGLEPLSAGQGRLDLPAALRGRPGQQLTAQLLDPFAQTGQPVAGAGQVQPFLDRTIVLHSDGQGGS